MRPAYSTHDLIHLCHIPSVGTYRIRKLVEAFKDPEQLRAATINDLRRVDGFEETTARQIRDGLRDDKLRDRAQRQIEQIEKFDARVITFWEDDYPKNLRSIYNPPVLLFVRGSLAPEDEYAVAMVGSRSVTDYGRLASDKLAHELSAKGITIVSGMATGIDTCAHRGALKANGRTTAVLGCGVDIVYPAENAALYREIVEKGAVVSEFPIGTKPSRGNFPARNRIISGMSLGTVVVEAGKKSGALLTAAAALEQNREVFAVPGNINNRQSEGSNRLIKDGAAKLVLDADDVVEELGPKLKHLSHAEEPDPVQLQLTHDEAKIFAMIGHEPVNVDKMVEHSEYTAAQTAGPLLTLELKGLIRRLPGSTYVRV